MVRNKVEAAKKKDADVDLVVIVAEKLVTCHTAEEAIAKEHMAKDAELRAKELDKKKGS